MSLVQPRLSVQPIIFEAVRLSWRRRTEVLGYGAVPALVYALAVPFAGATSGGLVASFVQAAAFVVFAVRWHRAILLDASSNESFILPRWGWRETRFLALAFGIYLVAFLPIVIAFLPLIPLAGLFPGLWEDERGSFIVAGALIPVGAYVVARCSLALPAAAIDARISLAGAWQWSNGNGWRLALLVVVLPYLLWALFEFFAGQSWLAGGGGDINFNAVVSSAGQAAIALGVFSIEVALLSLSYRALEPSMGACRPTSR
jgi:hypothetical protein